MEQSPTKRPKVASKGSGKKGKMKESISSGLSPYSVQQLSSPAGEEWMDDLGMFGDVHKDHKIAAPGTTGTVTVEEFKVLCDKEDSLPCYSTDSELCQHIGVTDDILQDIKKTCNPQSLLSAPPSTDKDSPLNFIHSQRRSVLYLDKLDHTSICFSNVMYNHSSEDAGTPVNTKQIILCVDVFHPTKTLREQHYLVLASQKLTELRDKILCPSDYYCTEGLSTDPAALSEETAPPQGPTNFSKSAFFFIGNRFYNDMRHPKATDMSRKIISWSEAGDRMAKSSRLDHFDAHLMEGTTIEMLEFRLGWPYLYCHHGNCNHLIIFRDMRLFNARNDPPFLENYPRLLFYNKSLIKKQVCHVCDKDAMWVTVNDEFSSGNGNLTFFCQVCFVRLHYTTEGEKVNRQFEAYRYRAPDLPTVVG